MRLSREDEFSGRTECHQAEKEKGTEEAGALGRKAFASLTRKGDFRRVFDQGSKTVSRYAVFYILPNGLSHCRVGLAVGKKLGNAVTRNRVRRRIREILRAHLRELTVMSDIVIVARTAVIEADFAALGQSFVRSLKGSS